MHEAGVVEFESHTRLHALVFDSDRIADFVHPGYDAHFYGNVTLPLYRRDGRDAVDREPLLGMPLYRARPRMTARARFFEDERVRERCLAAVRAGGGEAFFAQRDWRDRLRRVAREVRGNGDAAGRFETPEERDAWILDDLRRARETVEAQLPGRAVTQVCWPWYEAADFAVDAARATGHRVTYFGLLPGRRANAAGDDPLHVPRVEEVFLERLPGGGRRSLRDILAESYLRPVRPAEAGPPAGNGRASAPDPGSSSA